MPPQRLERSALAGQYAQMIESLLPQLNAATLPIAIQIAALPEKLRGFGDVRKSATQAFHTQAASLLQSFETKQTAKIRPTEEFNR